MSDVFKVLTGFTVFVLLAVIFSGCIPLPTKTKQGYTLVVAHNLGSKKGQIDEHKAGITWLRGFYVDSYKMPNSIQEDVYKYFHVVSKDNQRLPVQLVVQYRVNSANGCGSALYIDYRKNIENIIEDDLYSSAVDMSLRTFSNYNADEIFGQDISTIADELTTKAKGGSLIGTRLTTGELCLLVEQVKIADIDADDAIKNAVANKIVRDQEVQEEEAQTKIVREQLTQDSLRAEIQALNNKKLTATLTREVLEKQKLDNQAAAISKWNGQLPTYAGDIPFLFTNR